MSFFWQDIKHGFRMLRKDPGFTVLAVLTLGVGIGVNIAIFSFLDRILLRRLPVERPHELVAVEFRTGTGSETDDTFNYPLYTSYRERSEVFSGLTAHWADMVELNAGVSPEHVMGTAVSSNYFSVLGIKPALGRTFLPAEEQTPGADKVAIISHGFWRQRFSADPAVLGKTILLDGQPLTIVGVAPPQFTGTCVGVGPAVYVPLSTWASAKGFSLDRRDYTWLHLLGRLKPDVTSQQAQANLAVLAEQVRAIDPMNTHTDIVISDGSRGLNVWRREGWWWPLALLQTVTALVLLVACANVANMLLARGLTRGKEIALRQTLGAGRGRIVRQLLVESALLALLSGGCGTLLAHWLSIALRGALTVASQLNTPVGVDGRIAAFALAGSLGAVLVFGLAPALRVSRSNVMSALKDAPGTVAALSRRWTLRNLLVVTQVATAVIVLAFGALCVRSLGALRSADAGFDTSKVLGVTVDFERGPAKSMDAGKLFAGLHERVAAFGGVEAVSLAANVPLTLRGRNKTGVKHIEQFEMPPDQEWLSLDYAAVGPGYFRTLGVPLLRGRDFTPEDGPGAAKVMIVNELWAQRFWPDQDPIGKRVTFYDEQREVIGVVKTVKLNSIDQEPIPLMFWPLTQPMAGKTVADIKPVMLVRVSDDPSAVAPLLRDAMASSGIDLAACDIRTLAEQALDLVSGQRMMAALLNAVGLVGLLFVGTGIFGVMAFEVSRRTREIGVRMALGASWPDVLTLILRRGMALTVAGLGLGIGLSLVPLWFLGHLLPEIRMWDAYFLYGVHLWDPLTYVLAAAVVVLATLAACYLPARRAARIDPMEALRYE